MSDNVVQLPVAAPRAAGNPPTIAERVARGRETQGIADGAIVPPPASFGNVPLPNALRWPQAGIVNHFLDSGFRETDRHIYRDETGTEIMAVVRYEKTGEKKQFRPLRYVGKDSEGVARYDLTAVDAPRPIYQLPELATRSDATVIVVEGEKAAKAAAQRFPEYATTTVQNGSQGVGSADLRPLAGRRVVLWPDHDKDGQDWTRRLAGRLLQIGCQVSVVEVPESYPEKWDLADPDPDGIAAVLAPPALLAAAQPVDPSTVIAERPAVPAHPSRARGNETTGSADMHRFWLATTYLATVGKRSYAPGGGYGDWLDLMVAAKNSFGEAAFGPFCALSRDHGGTDSDEKIRSKWDSIEPRPEGGQLTAATFFREAIDAGWEDPTRGDKGEGGNGGGGKAERADPASTVLQQAADAGDQLWLNQHGKPYATMRASEPGGAERVVHVRVGGKRHKGIVSRRYRAAHPNKVLSAEQEKRAMLLLEHEARESGMLRESAMRAASHGGELYVDLGSATGEVARVSAEGWEVLPAAPEQVRFVRGTRGALPTPEPGGTLADFQRHFNLSHTDLLRVVAFIVGVLAPLPSFPILLIEGGQGTGKSMLGDMVAALCDPPHEDPKNARLTMPRGEQNLLVHASGVRLVYVDNLSDISEAESDALCRLATGGGTSARQHYSDEDEVQISATRPAVVTAIGTPTSRGDFLDRCLRVTGLPIQRRATEETLHAAFAADRPRMFGFVLTALSCALRNKAAVAAKVAAGEFRLARMADFGLLAESAAEVLGLDVGDFSAGLLHEVSAMQAESALGEPLGEALVRYFSADSKRKVLDGAATEVLDQLQNMVRQGGPALPAGNKLKGALRRIEPGLRDLGLAVTVTDPAMGVKNRKTIYKIATTDTFVPIPKEFPF